MADPDRVARKREILERLHALSAPIAAGQWEEVLTRLAAIGTLFQDLQERPVSAEADRSTAEHTLQQEIGVALAAVIADTVAWKDGQAAKIATAQNVLANLARLSAPQRAAYFVDKSE
jgi:hypothetical protein